MLAQPVKLNSITEHHITTGEHFAQCFTGSRPLIFPQIFAIVDVEADGNAQLVGDVEGLKCGICSLLRDGCRDARHMKELAVSQYLPPGNHARLQVVVGGIATVVDDLGCTHAGGRLEIVGADALTAIEHVIGIHTQLCQIHGSGMTNGGVWQTGDIGHILSLSGE